MFFTLRDRAAQMDVRVPGSVARKARVVAGERVSVVANLQWANERGQLHLVAEEVMPVGAGAIAALIAATRQKLQVEGLIGRPRRPIPRLPEVVGVVCGADAAVRKDIESVMALRCAGYPVVFEETTVSGPAASLTIVEAIERVAARPGVAVVILARGGGDAPSLLPWSTEEVCRAVAACPVPVVSAIGHEADRPLCDEVADLRCGTPSLAATAVLPDMGALAGHLDGCLGRARAAASMRLEGATRRLGAVDTRRSLGDGLAAAGVRLDRAALRMIAGHPTRLVAAARVRLGAPAFRRHMAILIGRAEGRLDADLRHLGVLSPWRTLERGYAVVSGPDGAVLRSASAVRAGDMVGVHLAEGAFTASVVSFERGFK